VCAPILEIFLLPEDTAGALDDSSIILIPTYQNIYYYFHSNFSLIELAEILTKIK
jgi:hypothetical protein